MDQPLTLLSGVWRGGGVAEFPTIDRVEFTETLTMEWDADRNVLCYEQITVLVNGRPSHREVGFLRTNEDGVVVLWNVQDNGRAETLEGPVHRDEEGGLTVALRSVAFGNDPRMLTSQRVLRLEGDVLRYELTMSTTTTMAPDVLPHLTSELTRVSEGS